MLLKTSMNKPGKRKVYFYLLLLIVILTLAACGGGGGGDPDPGGGGGGGGPNPNPNPSPSPSPTPTPNPGTNLPAWSATPVMLNASTDSVYETQLAYDDLGNGIAVWVERDTNSVNRLFYSRYTGTNDTWSTPQLIDETPTINAQTGPGHEYRVERVSLAIEENSTNAYVVWFTTNVGLEGKVKASMYDSTAGTWSTPTILNNDQMADARAISVSSNGGVTVATWLEVDAQTTDGFADDIYGVYASEASGSNWSAAQKIDDGTQVHYTPRIEGYIPPIALIDFNGNTTVIYNYVTTTWTVWAAEKPNGGAWQTPVQIDGGGAAPHQDISGTVTEDGTLHAVWVDYMGTLNDVVMYSRKSAGALTWSAPVVVESEAGSAFSPVFAGNANGDGIVAWVNDNGPTDMMVSHYDTATDTWGAAIPVGDGVLDSRQPKAIMDPLGNAVVVWKWVNLWYSFYSPTDGWTQIAAMPGGRHGMHYEFAWRGSSELSLIWAHTESGMDPEVMVSTLQ